MDWHAVDDVALYSENTPSKLMRSVTLKLGFTKSKLESSLSVTLPYVKYSVFSFYHSTNHSKAHISLQLFLFLDNSSQCASSHNCHQNIKKKKKLNRWRDINIFSIRYQSQTSFFVTTLKLIFPRDTLYNTFILRKNNIKF